MTIGCEVSFITFLFFKVKRHLRRNRGSKSSSVQESVNEASYPMYLKYCIVNRISCSSRYGLTVVSGLALIFFCYNSLLLLLLPRPTTITITITITTTTTATTTTTTTVTTAN
uniref:Uncharacterized protein n=1 Tax=Glossina brevipalpis TaxID=37001 RepID=A0A1A9X3R3_9MUSC